MERESKDLLAGEIEAGESYFGGKCKDRRGRGAAGKVPVYGLLKRGGRVYVKIIEDASGKTLMSVIQRKIVSDSIVYTDCWKGYDVLDISDFHHVRINHSELFADGRSHINGIENFWNQAKRHLRRFNGIQRAHFGLFLKECEWRFNCRDLKRQIRQLN